MLFVDIHRRSEYAWVGRGLAALESMLILDQSLYV
jgi:hypothetical protein